MTIFMAFSLVIARGMSPRSLAGVSIEWALAAVT